MFTEPNQILNCINHLVTVRGLVGALFCNLLLVANPSFAAVIEYNCKFDIYASKDGLHHYKDIFSFEIFYDTGTKAAFIKGNNGMESLVAIVGDSGISFLEILATGAVQSTTVSTSGSAIHSRHSMLSGVFIPTQSYGTCTTIPQ